MAASENGNPSPPPPGGDGVRVTENASGGSRSGWLYKALALVLAGCFIGYLITMASDHQASGNDRVASDAGTPGARATNGTDGAASAAITTGDRQLTGRPTQVTGNSNDPNDLANFYVPGQPAPSAKEVIEELNKAGIHTGIGAFPPPGTSPPLIGLAVPEDYVLPPGYVRHFQATDDGQRIEPILMYSPDFEFFDSAGRRIEIPPDRVVPPEMAPPGLPLRPIEIPPPIDPRSTPA
ncbi:MAG: hypothetical protein NT117_01860 [Gammaproteobacteria bacterium]|nr:hypothetical protein [Gammaproteobacteria bacterium]